ncbi:MAG: hypothetical protein WAU01_03320, partial [Saprospiraceae bacterium]
MPHQHKFYIIAIFFLVVIHSTTHAQNFELVRFSSGFVKPVDIAATGINSDERLFVVEKDGRIRILNKSGSVESINFLNITTKVNA